MAGNGNRGSILAHKVFWRGGEQSGCFTDIQIESSRSEISKKNDSEAVKRELKMRFQEN
jgi:hypothetical protein